MMDWNCPLQKSRKSGTVPMNKEEFSSFGTKSFLHLAPRLTRIDLSCPKILLLPHCFLSDLLLLLHLRTSFAKHAPKLTKTSFSLGEHLFHDAGGIHAIPTSWSSLEEADWGLDWICCFYCHLPSFMLRHINETEPTNSVKTCMLSASVWPNYSSSCTISSPKQITISQSRSHNTCFTNKVANHQQIGTFLCP